MKKLIVCLVFSLFPIMTLAALYGGGVKSIKGAQESMNNYVKQQTTGWDNPETLCNSTSLYAFKSDAGIYPINDCLIYAESIIAKATNENETEDKARRIEQEQTKQKETADLAIKNLEDQQQQQTLEADLKSGKKKPNNFKEVMIAYGAIDGNYLAGSPKIRADKALYVVIGKISFANEDDSFVAAFDDYGQKQFDVKIPPELKEEYLSTAQIGSYFIVVGRYNENKEYNAALGSTLSLPSFEAVYFKVVQ